MRASRPGLYHKWHLFLDREMYGDVSKVDGGSVSVVKPERNPWQKVRLSGASLAIMLVRLSLRFPFSHKLCGWVTFFPGALRRGAFCLFVQSDLP